MKEFAHVNAKSLEEAVSVLKQYGGRANVIAGGTDLLGKMKDEILPIYPEAIVNIKKIRNLDFISEENEVLRIGVLTRLEDIAEDENVKKNYMALAEACHRCASPHIREMGTIGGNICQDIRCWYYRNPNNRFPCLRKGGGRCYALEGDNRYHSVFGGSVMQGCYAVHPSDTAAALIALDAQVKTTKRTVSAEEFFTVDVMKTTVLDYDEIVSEIVMPKPKGKSSYIKFALRESIDFPIVSCAAMVALSGRRVDRVRICLNAVYLKPYRAHKGEEAILGKALNESNAKAAGEATVEDAQPMGHNRYMVPVARTLITRALLACK